MQNKRGQVTIFIIIAIVLVAVVAVFFLLKNDVLNFSRVPESLQPAYRYYLSCIEQEALSAVNIMNSQGGYLEIPELEMGSAYMPFSSQLNFLGIKVPYWEYVSGNNIVKQQVPSKSLMEKQLGEFIDSRISRCDFSDYFSEGFDIEMGASSTEVAINSNNVKISVSQDLIISKGDEKAQIKNHPVEVASNFGGFYESAKKVYDYEQETLFLEEYGLDVLRLYAPVDGVEISCGPKVWNSNEIFKTLEQAIQANTLALKNGAEKEYFSVNLPVRQEVNFMASPNWAKRFEAEPSEENFLIAKPIGNQEGLGILGFCYVPYHFVYTLRYPVLVQIREGDEIFQFPILVRIERNNPRVPLKSEEVVAPGVDICPYKNTPMIVSVYDSNLKPVEANISYECLGEKCSIGQTSSGVLQESFPQCSGGTLLVSASGFAESRSTLSTINSGNFNVILDKTYPIEIDLKLGGVSSSNPAMISFISDYETRTLFYPQEKTIELHEGVYKIQVQSYENGSIKFGASTVQKCVDVPEGFSGLLGFTKEKCFEITSPEQIISSVLSGGGKTEYYALENKLQSSRIIEINAEKLPVPTTIEQLNSNHAILEEKKLSINFR